MEKSTKVLLLIVIVLGLSFLLGLYLFVNKNKSTTEENKPDGTQTLQISQEPQKGELNYQEPQSTVEIGTKEVTKGTFEKVENGNIFVREGDKLTQIALTVDEIAVSCTTQDLSSATELDFNQITKVNVATPANLATFIPAQETVVVFTQQVEGVNQAHTVALDASKCTQ